MSEKFSRSPVHYYTFISRQFEPLPVSQTLTKEQIHEIAREIIALSSWDETKAE